MQGNGLEKESWAHLPLLVISGPTLIELSHANNRDASEAPVQDLQVLGVVRLVRHACVSWCVR